SSETSTLTTGPSPLKATARTRTGNPAGSLLLPSGTTVKDRTGMQNTAKLPMTARRSITRRSGPPAAAATAGSSGRALSRFSLALEPHVLVGGEDRQRDQVDRVIGHSRSDPYQHAGVPDRGEHRPVDS